MRTGLPLVGTKSASGNPLLMIQSLMNHPHRHRPVAGPRFFDTEVLEVVLHVLQRRGAKQLGDAEIKGVGQLFEIVQTDVALAALDVHGRTNAAGAGMRRSGAMELT